MYQLVQHYLERSEYARTPEQLREAMSAVIAPIDLFAFAFLALPGGGQPLLISTYPPDWTDHYIEQGYQRRDPVILHSHCVFNLFTWNPQMAKKFGPGARDLFFEAEKFDIRYGITIPIHDWPGGLAAMTFATDRRGVHYASCLRCNTLGLLFITLHFRNHLRRMLEPVWVIEGAKLTPRECECLEWTTRGKSSTDIAHILNVSHRIVARDLESVRAKLDVRSINQAVALYASHKITRSQKDY